MTQATAIDDSASSLLRKADQFGNKRYVVKQPLRTTSMDPMEYAKHVGDIKRSEAKDIEDKVSKNLKVINALTELKKVTTEVKKFSEQLSNYLGIDRDRPNLWKKKESNVLDANGQDAKHLVRITSDRGTPVRDFTLEVLQMAKADTLQATSTFASKDNNLNLNGNLNIKAGNANYTIDLAGKSLSDIANAVNANTGSTKIKMELLQTSPTGDFRWQLIHQDKSVPIDLTGTDAAVLTSFFVPTDPQDNTLPRITSADSLLLKIKYNGELVTRSGTNFASDIIPDATVEVYADNTGPLSCKVDYDRTSVVDGVANFVKAYNDFRKYVREQTAFEADKKTPKPDAYLHNNNTLKSEIFEIEKVLSTWVKGISGTASRTLAEIGLPIGKSSTRTDATGNLIVDSALDGDIAPDVEKLEKLLYSDKIKEVMGVLGNNVTNTNDYFSVYAIPDFNKNGSLAGIPVTVTIAKQNGSFVATLSADPGNGVVNIPGEYKAGGLVNGPKGTIFEGFSVACQTQKINSLVDNGPGISTTTTATMGIFATLERTIDNYINYTTGKIDLEIKRLQEDNIRNELKAEKLNAEAYREEESIIKQFQYIRELEQSYNSLSDMFDTMMKVMTSDK